MKTEGSEEQIKKPMVGLDSGTPACYIDLKIKYSPNGHEVYFNVKRSSQLRTIMTVSCERLSLELDDIRFVYKGHYVLAEATPEQLEMEDGDVIDAISRRPRNQLTADPGTINLTVICQLNGDKDTVIFRINKETKLKKLMTAYCDRRSLHPRCLAFLWDGCCIRDNATPYEMDMEDGDEIYVMPHLPLCECCHQLPVVNGTP